MASILDPARVTGEGEAPQDLAQFEPDPDGDVSTENAAAPPDEPADAAWVVWTDPEGASAWAAGELDKLVPGRRAR